MNSENEFLKFATRKWYVIDSESKGSYSQDDSINFLTKLIESGLCNYSDAYILATGNIVVKRRNAADPADIALCPITQVAFKNCVPFKTSKTEINDAFVHEAEELHIAMPMYNLIEYSDNYFDKSKTLWGFERYETKNNADVSNDDNAPSFKCKSSLIGDTESNGIKSCKNSCNIKIFEQFLEIIRNAFD